MTPAHQDIMSRIEKLEPVPAGELGLVHRLARLAQQKVSIRLIMQRIQGDARARRNPRGMEEEQLEHYDYRMDRCLRLTYRYHYVDVVELRVSAWNGSFGGSTCLYVGQSDLADAATLLLGFPNAVDDKREVTFGAFGPKLAGGAMELQFSCADGAGHARLDVTIEADYEGRDSRTERVELTSAFEPAALDQFVGQMRELDASLTGSAVLAFA
jgi:hypothetical protein